MCIPPVTAECNAYLPDKDIPRAGSRQQVGEIWQKRGWDTGTYIASHKVIPCGDYATGIWACSGLGSRCLPEAELFWGVQGEGTERDTFGPFSAFLINSN